MQEISGNLSGIRDSVITQMEALYGFEVDSDQFLPLDLARELARFTALVRREIAVYIARNGRILDISIGQNDRVSLQDLGQRRSDARLSRVRCIHTHPNGDPVLSDVDIAAVVSLRLDAMCALGVDEQGGLTGASLSLLAPDEEGVLTAGPVTMIDVRQLEHPQLMALISQNDQLATLQSNLTEDSAERAYLVSVDSQASLD
ncbi:MAG TPA: hypothetical protein PLR12_04825, partial [Clostridia bacterium]|nr:hypothetical protein [Clostridia bacterium]